MNFDEAVVVVGDIFVSVKESIFADESHKYDWVGIKLDGHNASWLKSMIETDYNYHMAVRTWLATVIELTGEVPEDWRSFVIDVLEGEIKPPKKTRGRKVVNKVRDDVIRSIIRSLVEHHSFQATRNPKSPEVSACDVVRFGLRKINIYIEYKAVEKICLKRTKI